MPRLGRPEGPRRRSNTPHVRPTCKRFVVFENAFPPPASPRRYFYKKGRKKQKRRKKKEILGMEPLERSAKSRAKLAPCLAVVAFLLPPPSSSLSQLSGRFRTKGFSEVFAEERFARGECRAADGRQIAEWIGRYFTVQACMCKTLRNFDLSFPHSVRTHHGSFGL